MELPPAPDEMTFTEADRAFYDTVTKVFEKMRLTVEGINEWTDALVKRVNPDSLDRRTKETLTRIMWQAEFIERVLKHQVPPVAVMEMVDYMRTQQGDTTIHVQEITPEEAKERGYL